MPIKIQVAGLPRPKFAAHVYLLAVTAFTFVNPSAPLTAQTTFPPPFPDPSTCPIQAGIKSFILEEKLGPTSFQSVFTPTFPPAAIAALSDPTKEVHVHFTFDTADMMARTWTIPLPLGSPAISPDTTDFNGLAVATAFAKIDRIYTVCFPRPSIMISGNITSATTIFGNQNGIPHGMAFSYDPTITSFTNNVANITTFDAGTSTVFALQASAIVTPATTTAVISGAPVINAMFRQLLLDGTASASVTGQMKYQWTAAHGADVGIVDPVSPQTRIVLNGPAGDYPVTLTVSTPYETVTSTVTVHYAPLGQ